MICLIFYIQNLIKNIILYTIYFVNKFYYISFTCLIHKHFYDCIFMIVYKSTRKSGVRSHE